MGQGIEYWALLMSATFFDCCILYTVHVQSKDTIWLLSFYCIKLQLLQV